MSTEPGKTVLFRVLLRGMRVADVLLFSYVNRNINPVDVFKK
jgi:succinate dehydrogenase flavin-adding protein (antitoxin of CptAB toxin-antitoxin module)